MLVIVYFSNNDFLKERERESEQTQPMATCRVRGVGSRERLSFPLCSGRPPSGQTTAWAKLFAPQESVYTRHLSAGRKSGLFTHHFRVVLGFQDTMGDLGRDSRGAVGR